MSSRDFELHDQTQPLTRLFLSDQRPPRPVRWAARAPASAPLTARPWSMTAKLSDLCQHGVAKSPQCRTSICAIGAECCVGSTTNGEPHWHCKRVTGAWLPSWQVCWRWVPPRILPRWNHRSAVSGRRSTERAASRSAGSCSSSATGSTKALLQNCFRGRAIPKVRFVQAAAMSARMHRCLACP